ncbi:MAG TPA: hypothetical protein VFQ53_08575 [Kofleriaceae bacterium]|nr:hypothetical protein [Kofleriaceae bacterium]
MRRALILGLVTSIAACGSDPSEGDDDPIVVGDTPAFTITSADITLQPGEENTYCFYFHTPNTTTAAVGKWVSDMTAGSHHMIYFSNLTGDQPADGTVDDCNLGGSAVPLPVYGTQIAHEEVVFPTDDGQGNPLGQEISPNTAGFFQMHYLNATDQPLTAHVTLEAYALPETATYTKTDLFATYNSDIAIPPGATNFVVSATCDVVNGKFWSMSSHSHKQSIATSISDGAATVFSSTDWEHPGTLRFDPDFYQFSSQITWSCTYNNTGDNAAQTVYAGQSAQTNEMCMATGYYFPARGPKGCFFSDGACQCLL